MIVSTEISGYAASALVYLFKITGDEAYLARAGKKVLLVEKEVFPRFHIGESLLPYNMRIFRELGVIPALEAAGFPRKFGAQFELGDGSKSAGFVFGDGKFTKEIQAFQVERSIT